MFDFNLYVRTKLSCVMVKNRATANLSLTRFQINDAEIPLHNLWTFLHLIFLRPHGAAIDFKLEYTNMN